MDAQLMEAVAEILADALPADLEANLESEKLPSVTPDTGNSPTGSGSQMASSVDGGSDVGGSVSAA